MAMDDKKELVLFEVSKAPGVTRHGKILRDRHGRFALGSFKEIEFVTAPAELIDETHAMVQCLVEHMPVVIDGILVLDEKLAQLQGAVGNVQEGIDQINFKLDRTLRAKLDYVHKLLKRADSKGEAAGAYLAKNAPDIFIPLGEIEIEVKAHLEDANLAPGIRICLMGRLVLLRHVLAKVSLACEESEEACQLLRETRDQILVLARALLEELIVGVDILNIPENKSPADEIKLLQMLEIIDGVSPDDRRFEIRTSSPSIPAQPRKFTLESVQSAPAYRYGEIARDDLLYTWVQRGTLIARFEGWDYLAPIDGFLVATGNDPRWWSVLEIPTLKEPCRELADHIANLADIVEYATRLDGEMEMAAGNAELARKLLIPGAGDLVVSEPRD